MYWTRLVLVRPAASLYSASPRKHHATGRQLCPNPDHYPEPEPASRSLNPLCWALSRAAEPQNLSSFVWRGRGSNHQHPACQGNAQPLHYPAAVAVLIILCNWPSEIQNLKDPSAVCLLSYGCFAWGLLGIVFRRQLAPVSVYSLSVIPSRTMVRFTELKI